MSDFVTFFLPILLIVEIGLLSRSIHADSEKLRQPQRDTAGAEEQDAAVEPSGNDFRELTDAELTRWKWKMGAMLGLVALGIALAVRDCSQAGGLLG